MLGKVHIASAKKLWNLFFFLQWVNIKKPKQSKINAVKYETVSQVCHRRFSMDTFNTDDTVLTFKIQYTVHTLYLLSWCRSKISKGLFFCHFITKAAPVCRFQMQLVFSVLQTFDKILKNGNNEMIKDTPPRNVKWYEKAGFV